jgi:uracil DNA glycosylase
MYHRHQACKSNFPGHYQACCKMKSSLLFFSSIYKELKNDIDGFVVPNHGTLIGWATQGKRLILCQTPALIKYFVFQ